MLNHVEGRFHVNLRRTRSKIHDVHQQTCGCEVVIES